MHHRSMCVLSFRLLLSSALLVTACCGGSLNAATKAEKLRASAGLVQEALHREIYGQGDERAELLSRAATETPDYAPAMWHRGYVRWQNKWVKAEEIPALAESDPRIVAYRKIRGEYPNTVQGQLELADWCQKKSLAECERAHLTAVLSLDPNNATARNRLGFQRVDGEWVSEADLAEAAAQLDATRHSLATWRTEMETISKLLATKSEAKREAAKQRALKIVDGGAVPALEHYLANEGQSGGELAIETLAGIHTHESSLAMARLAVFSPWPSVRELAARSLKDRPEDTYVPSLLASMYTPLVARAGVVPGEGGRLLYRHAFMREGQNEKEVLVLDTAYQRVARVGGDGRETLSRMLSDANDTALRRQLSVAQQNRRTEELNNRVAAALNTSTSQQLPAQPQTWWDWWNDHNEIFVQGDKQVQTVRRAQQVEVVDFVPQGAAAAGAALASASAAQDAKDCLAPGTKVWTATGAVSVEELQVGDLVLSQEVDTGELAYKPVIRTTIRPKTSLIRITAGDQVIQASGGHPFWVSGEGWVKARNLVSGMELHCAAGTVRITGIEKQTDEIQTYNLVVADFNTYFIGPACVLSHDNTVREATSAIVPGLAAE
jgi:hypothetical protein